MRAAPLLLLVAGCGLQPLYGGGATGAVAQGVRATSVGPIAGKSGWLMRNALLDRLGTPEGAAARYRLDVTLDDRIEGFGVRRDEAVTRQRRSLRARYQLVDTATGAVLLDATAGSDAGIDVVESGYATVAAENTALDNLTRTVADQIIARVALYLRRTPG